MNVLFLLSVTCVAVAAALPVVFRLAGPSPLPARQPEAPPRGTSP